MIVPVNIEVPAPTVNLNLPQGMPLMCDIKEASHIFGVSEGTLRKLYNRNRNDFPAKKIGRAFMILVPDLYAWIKDFPGDIPTE